MKYVLHKNPLYGRLKNKNAVHARVFHNSTMDMEKLYELISARSSLSSADVKGVLDSFRFFMIISLKNGETIKLEELGHFYPTLKSKCYTDEDGKEQFQVKVATVGFRCDPKLKKEIRLARLVEEKLPKSTAFSFEQRKSRILKEVAENLTVNSTDVMRLNRCTRRTALADLKKLTAEGSLYRADSGKTSVYFLPPEQG